MEDVHAILFLLRVKAVISRGGQRMEFSDLSYLVARIHVHSLMETVKGSTVFDMVRRKGGGSPIRVMVSKRWMKEGTHG